MEGKKKIAYERLQRGEITVDEMRAEFGLPPTKKEPSGKTAQDGDDGVEVGEELHENG